MQSLRKQADDYRPTLTPLGALERDLLDRSTARARLRNSSRGSRSDPDRCCRQRGRRPRFLKQTIERFGELVFGGFSTRSITMTSTGARTESNLESDCS
jgi:hypothetical protein